MGKKRWAVRLAAALLLAAGAAAQQKPAEWKPLFDGKSLEGWRETPFTGRGKVWVEDGVLMLGAGTLTGVTWTAAFPTSNYEVRFEAARLEGNDFFAGLTFPVQDSYCSWIVGGWGGGVVGLSNVDGWAAADNQTYQWREFENRRWYRLRLRVTGERIQAWIDDEEYVNQELAGHVINLRFGEIKLSAPFGFASYGTTAGLRKMEYRLLPAPRDGR
ncbi:MAG: DUF1080 domain-containing protein [Bryobacterales bacterium]|nr:DUF1080 domain-containing protein [Bryobacterales bacterium]